MTKVFFVRHAEPVHSHSDDRTRPLTEEGMKDTALVVQTLKDKGIEAFFCSPYKRSIDTIKDAAAFYYMDIYTDERFREREHGIGKNNHEMFQKRWADHTLNEEGGESIEMVQRRNIEALFAVLDDNQGKNIVIGTHGTALSTIINYFKPEFGCDDFLRIIDWMPYIVEMDFDGQNLIAMKEIAYIEKEFKRNE